jgi:hypothetical protein
VRFRVLVAAVVIIGASGAGAAQAVVTTQEVPPETTQQVRAFETSLRAALERASQKLASRAREVVPDIELQYLTPPRATGMVLPQGELVFLVEAPAIEATSAALWQALRRLGLSKIANPVGPERIGPTTTDGVSAVAPPAPMTNPEREYSAYVKEALIDALLDHTLGLPITGTQTLTLVEAGGLPTNPLAAPPRKLYLQMKGEDLLAVRQSRITREEAKKRILEIIR